MKSVSVGVEKLFACANTSKSSRSPNTKFMNAPAQRIKNRFHAGWLVNARGSSTASSSPAMAQKPPIGRQRTA